MKLKSGPVLVIGVLVLLVGLTLVLTPAPPPPSDHHHEHEEEPVAKEKPKEPEKPARAVLAEIKQILASQDAHGWQLAMDKLNEIAVTTRQPEEKQQIREYVRSLTKDPRDLIRVGAVSILTSMKEEDYQLFLQLAQQDNSPQVRQAAIMALARFPAGGPVEQALRKLAQHPDAGIRSVAVVSLTQMLSLAGQAGSEELVKLLGVRDNDASAQAALKFHSQGAAALPTLIKALQTSPSAPARHAAAMCIGLICAGYNPYIEKFARQARVTHRVEFGHKPSNPAGVLPLIQALRDPDPSVREIAAQGLGYLGDERAVRPLARALRDPDPYVRRRAAAALITLPAEGAVNELAAAATQDKDPEVRRFAVQALGWIGGSVAVNALCQATKDKEAEVRRQAAMELGRIADPTALQSLSALLGDTPDPDPDVRWAAVVAIGKLRDRRAEHILVKALSDPSPQVAISAEHALQRLGIARREEAGFEG